MTNSNQLTKEVSVREIKTVIDIISLVQSRIDAFQIELDFFVDTIKKLQLEQQPDQYFISLLNFALKRLDNEVMFLCIETYSLHESISKTQSLYTKYIAGLGKQILQVDKRPPDPKTYHLNGWSDLEKQKLIEKDHKQDILNKKNFRNRQGITANPQGNL